jgi:hypothetical protein
MDTEQFEKAVTDYEKAFKLDKTKGNSFSFSVKLVFNLNVLII